MAVFHERSEFVEICSKEEASKKLKCKKSSLITDKVVVVDLRNRDIGSDPTLVMCEKTPFTVHSHTPISVEINGIIACVSPGSPFIYYPYKSDLFRGRNVATAVVLLAVFAVTFVWAPWSEPVIAESVQVAGYKSLSDLPDEYLGMVPKLKAVVKEGGEVEREVWNRMIRSLVFAIQVEKIKDPGLIALYEDIVQDPGMDKGTIETAKIAIELQLQKAGD